MHPCSAHVMSCTPLLVYRRTRAPVPPVTWTLCCWQSLQSARGGTKGAGGRGQGTSVSASTAALQAFIVSPDSGKHGDIHPVYEDIFYGMVSQNQHSLLSSGLKIVKPCGPLKKLYLDQNDGSKMAANYFQPITHNDPPPSLRWLFLVDSCGTQNHPKSLNSGLFAYE